mmetsp:Transcript_58217/g.155037  ORF Transcript_58217/g.155037 Transcript_58217/m.155037 type:complete len:221 (-) Transcript_58217:465-1127(-)
MLCCKNPRHQVLVACDTVIGNRVRSCPGVLLSCQDPRHQVVITGSLVRRTRLSFRVSPKCRVHRPDLLRKLAKSTRCACHRGSRCTRGSCLWACDSLFGTWLCGLRLGATELRLDGEGSGTCCWQRGSWPHRCATSHRDLLEVGRFKGKCKPNRRYVWNEDTIAFAVPQELVHESVAPVQVRPGLQVFNLHHLTNEPRLQDTETTLFDRQFHLHTIVDDP